MSVKARTQFEFRMEPVDDLALNVESAIRHLYRNRIFTDFTFYFENEEFHVHALVLAIHSSRLADMIFGTEKCRELKIEGVGISAVRNMIRYFYGEELVIENIFDVKDTKIIAETFKINELCNIFKAKLYEIPIEVSNVVIVLETAIGLGNKQIETKCLQLINENKETVFRSQPFMEMKFGDVLTIFEKLRDMGSLTEASFLHSTLSWLESKNNVDYKNELMKKVTISKLCSDEFVNTIISFPKFFSNTEISSILKEIKSVQDTPCSSQEKGESGNSTDDECAALASNTQKRELIVHIMKAENGNTTNRARVTMKDKFGSRSLQFEITGNFKQGIFVSPECKQTFSGVDISYEGIYFMMIYLKESNPQLHPINYIEMLKAALHFKLSIADECKMKIDNIVDYDPIFLDGLLQVHSKDRCIHLLVSKPISVIIHPNFINCSIELISLLLEQSELNLSEETQLLLVTISWLEAQNRLRWSSRSLLLSKIAFENLSCSNLEYVVRYYPEFFTDNEINSILSDKNGSKNKDNKVDLPEWYNNKSRKLLLK